MTLLFRGVYKYSSLISRSTTIGIRLFHKIFYQKKSATLNQIFLFYDKTFSEKTADIYPFKNTKLTI